MAPITRFATYLKGVYTSALLSSDKFPHLTCSKFINLALVKKERINQSEADKFTKATLHGHIDEILKKKEPIKLEEVLSPVEGQPDMKCIFLEGAPGIGKSTCVGELCKRWDEIDALKKYSLVILVRLREKRVQEAQSVEDLCFHRNKELRRAVAAEIEACEGRSVLFVLDGFDELPPSLRKESMFVELIQGTYLSHCTVLVTSRPSATADLLSVAKPQIHKQIEVVGFTQVSIEEYARTIFASQPTVLADFLKYIYTNPAVRSMMYIPLNSAIVVEVYRNQKTSNRPIPRTMTQLYSEISLVLLARHLGADDPLAEQLPEQLEKLPPEIYEPFILLAKVAFEGFEKKEVVFHDLSDGFIHFGFMNFPTDLYMGRKSLVSCSFLHLTLQEFLAAFHISQLSPSDQKSVFTKHNSDKWDSSWDVVWKFLAGLTGFRGIGWDAIIAQNRLHYLNEKVLVVGRRPYFIHCLYEAQSKVDYDLVLGRFVCIHSFLRPVSGVLDSYTLGYCVANTRCWWELTLSSRESSRTSGFEIVEMLKHGLCSSSTSFQKYHANIFAINVAGCGLDTKGFNLLAEIISLMVNLRKVDIGSNPGGDGALVSLFDALSDLKYLEDLTMVDTSIGNTDIQALSRLISPPSTLGFVKIGNHGMCNEMLLETVFSPSSLNNTSFSKMNFTDKIGALLEQNKNVKRIRTLTDDPSSLVIIARSLQKNSCLVTLEVFAVGSFVYDASDALSEMFKCNQSLETVMFKFSFFPPLGQDFSREQYKQFLSALNDALQYNQTLKKIIFDFSFSSKARENYYDYIGIKLDPRISLRSRSLGTHSPPIPP